MQAKTEHAQRHTVLTVAVRSRDRKSTKRGEMSRKKGKKERKEKKSKKKPTPMDETKQEK